MSRLEYKDPASYLSALLFRGGRTIIVEGPTDKQALDRALHEFERERRLGRGIVVVDSADSVGGVPGVGNRQRAQSLHAMAVNDGHVAYAFIDREFNGFVANDAEFRDEIGDHFQPTSNTIWTRGHSIENYFFDLEYAQDFVRYRYSDRVSSAMIDELARFWSQIVLQSSAYTVAVRDANAIERMSRALSVRAWGMPAPHTIELLPAELENSARSRGMTDADAVALVESFQRLLISARACPDADCCRWLAHGHLGDETIWLAVARVLLELGLDPDTANEVGHGRREEKGFRRADLWVSLQRAAGGVPTPEPLWRAIGVGALNG